MQREEWQFSGAGGAQLFVREWQPLNQSAHAVIGLVHGMGEHGDRYKNVAERMAEAGFILAAIDQHGHGRSSGKRGHMLSLDAAVSDVALFIEQERIRNPGLPIFLYGHSMGGNVALNCALRLRPNIRGLILTSPWLRLAFNPPPIKEWLGKRMASIIPTLQQSTGLNPADLFRPGYSGAIPIIGDPLCHTRITAKTYSEVQDGGRWALEHGKQLQIPTLLLHGTADRVTSFEASEQLAVHIGELCELKRYEGGFHELHNDLMGEKAINDIIAWLTRQLL